MTSEMQERIARAMADARVAAMKKRFGLDFDLPGYDEYTEEGKADALAEALAAMKAMREPTEERSRSLELGAKVRKVAAQLSVERFNGWANPLVSDLVDAADFLEGKTPMNESSEAVLSADAEISLAEGGKDD